MKERWISSLAIVASLALIAGIALAGNDENVWVTAEGAEVAIGSGKALFIAEDDGNAFDVSELADGESRVFGSGEKTITATRNGDVVTLHRPARDDRGELEVRCELPADTCRIVTFDDDAEKVALIIEKERECVNGEGDCDIALDITTMGHGSADSHTVVIRKTVECDDAGNCEEDIVRHLTGEGPHHGMIEIEAIGEGGEDGDVVIVHSGHHGNVKLVELDSRVVLRCPEGDTTMRVTREEAGDTFLCPKHSEVLERVEPHHRGVHKVKVQRKGE